MTSKLFGSLYNDVGSTSSNLLLKTRGLIRILLGNKFIDLIKDGKIVSDSNIIRESDSVGDETGIYVVNGFATLVIGGAKIPIGSEDLVYVSFLEEQKPDRDSKVRALTNIGFIYKNLDDVKDVSNGVVYIEDQKALYIVKDGVASNYFTNMPDLIKSLFIIERPSEKEGTVIIKGTSDKDSIVFDTMTIWSKGINFKEDFDLSYNNTPIGHIGEYEILVYTDLSAEQVKSNVFSDLDGSFRLQVGNDTLSELYVDAIFCNTIKYNSSSKYSENPPNSYDDYYKSYDPKEQVQSKTLKSSMLYPEKAIIMYCGKDIPEGWALCDGHVEGDITTPDLSDKFIIEQLIVYIIKLY